MLQTVSRRALRLFIIFMCHIWLRKYSYTTKVQQSEYLRLSNENDLDAPRQIEVSFPYRPLHPHKIQNDQNFVDCTFVEIKSPT